MTQPRSERSRGDGRPVLTLVGRSGMAITHLVVVVAHPDDESLCAGGLIHDAGRGQLRQTVIVASEGESSHPDSPTHSPERLARQRRAEVSKAVRTLDPRAELILLRLPDGRLGEYVDEIADQVRRVVAPDGPRALVISTWVDDGHPDHEAVGTACATAAEDVGARHLQAPIWAWEWAPEGIPRQLLVEHRLSASARASKRAAIDSHRSQVAPLSDAPGDEAVVTVVLQEHAAAPVEVFIDQGRRDETAAIFESMYDSGADPWRFDGSWYEERKRALVMAALPERDLGVVLEIGPATGLLTLALAPRAEQVVAVDISRRALDHLAARLSAAGLRGRVELLHGAVPDSWPQVRLDTVIASEVGYFMTARDWRRTIERTTDSLAPTGALVLVNWRHPVRGWSLDGEVVDRIAAQESGLETTTLLTDADFVLRVLRPPGLLSVAAAEGRC